MTNNKRLGNLGEKIAKEYYLKNSFSFVSQNYKSGRNEIDLIFKKDRELIFVEVKTRIETKESSLENPLTQNQTRNIKKAMIAYCLENKINFDNARLDLLIILTNKKTRLARLIRYPDII